MRRFAKVLSVAAGLLAVLATAGSALAHDDDDYGWKHRHHHRGPPFVPPGHVYYVERPVIYAPPPRVYYPEPMYYGPPAPPSLNINIPLR